jgi:hypothetical protein
VEKKLSNAVPNIIANYALANDLFDDPIFKISREHLCIDDEDTTHEANLVSVIHTHPAPCPGCSRSQEEATLIEDDLTIGNATDN